MFERIVIAAEFRRGKEEILNCLASLKHYGAKECLLVQYFDPRMAQWDPDQPAMDFTPFFQDMLEENLNQQKSQLEELGFAVEARTAYADLPQELDRIAREEGYDLIVVAAQEHSFIGQILFGGIARSVIHHASRPVLQVRVPDLDEEEEAGPAETDIARHILFPTDFSENADLAFEQVKDMVHRGAHRVTLAHVQDSARIDPYLVDQLEAFNQKDRERLEDMQAELQAAGATDVENRLLYGSPTAELFRLIEEEDVSLVVMGSQGRGFIQEIYLGSVSHNIARHAPVSVLLVPAKRTEDD